MLKDLIATKKEVKEWEKKDKEIKKDIIRSKLRGESKIIWDFLNDITAEGLLSDISFNKYYPEIRKDYIKKINFTLMKLKKFVIDVDEVIYGKN